MNRIVDNITHYKPVTIKRNWKNCLKTSLTDKSTPFTKAIHNHDTEIVNESISKYTILSGLNAVSSTRKYAEQITKIALPICPPYKIIIATI